MKEIVDAAGGLRVWQSFKPTEAIKFMSTFQQFQKDSASNVLAKAMEDAAFNMSMFGDKTETAALQLAGGEKNWKLLTENEKDSARATAGWVAAHSQMTTNLKDMQDALKELQNPATTGIEKTRNDISDLFDEVNKEDPRYPALQALADRLMDVARATDQVNLKKALASVSTPLDTTNTTLKSKISGVFSPREEALTSFKADNKELLATIDKIQDPITAMLTKAQMFAKVLQGVDLTKQLDMITKIRDIETSINRTQGEMDTTDPFQQWLLTIVNVDKITKQLKLPEGQNLESMRALFDKKTAQDGQIAVNKMMGDLQKQAIVLTAKDPFQSWVNSLMEVDQLTGRLKLPSGLTKENLKPIFDYKENLRVFQQFTDGVSGLFGQMFSDLKDKGFKGLFTSIYSGFSSLLYKMATEYLQSQIMQLLMHSLGGTGLPSGFGGGSGGSILGSIVGIAGSAIGSGGGGGNGGGGGAGSGFFSFGGTSGGGDGSGVLGSGLDHFAQGGRLKAGRSAIVGEYEPEIIRPAQDVDISNRDSNQNANTTSNSAGHTFNFSYQIVTNDPSKFRSSMNTTIASAKAQADKVTRRTQ